VTERKERRRRAKKAELGKALNSTRDEFSTPFPHDLRTPMTNIKMALRMLKVSPTIGRKKFSTMWEILRL